MLGINFMTQFEKEIDLSAKTLLFFIKKLLPQFLLHFVINWTIFSFLLKAYAVTALMKIYAFEIAAGRKVDMLPEVCETLSSKTKYPFHCN